MIDARLAACPQPAFQTREGRRLEIVTATLMALLGYFGDGDEKK